MQATQKSLPQKIAQRLFDFAYGEMVVAPIDTYLKNASMVINGNAVNVTENSAMKYSAVYACVRAIAETIATMPFRVYEYQDGYSSPANDHPVNYLISTEPNPQTGKIDFLETLLATALLWGNGYARIYRNQLMRPISYHYMHPADVKPFIDKKTGELYYAVRVDGKTTPDILNDTDLIHIKALSLNGIEGISPIRAHAETIGLGMSATKFGANFFTNGANMSGVLQTDGKLSDPVVRRLGEQWEAKYSGVQSSSKTAILEEGLKYQRIGIPPNEAQFIETRSFQVEDIARIYRVPQNKVGKIDKASYNSLEQQNIEFVQDSLRPWIKKVEEEFDRKSFRFDERSKYFTRIDFNSLLRGDTRTRVEAQWKWLQMGVLNPNEIRAMEGLSPRKDAQGSDYYVPLNLDNASTPNEDGKN
jgi:HK97 family phage portal protein